MRPVRWLLTPLRWTFSRSARAGDGVAPWSRQQLVAVLAVLAVTAVVSVFGLGLAAYYSFSAHRHHSASQPTPGSSSPVTSTEPTGAPSPTSTPAGGSSPGASRPTAPSSNVAAVLAAENALAAAAMPSATLTDAEPGAPISAKDPGQITLPKSAARDALGVSTRFPHTAAGALAQMASIDSTAFDSGTLAGVRSVIKLWAAPGGPTPSDWSGVKAMASFFDAAGLSGGGSQQLAMVMTPVMGLIKGTVGPDFVVGCINFELDATLNQTQRVAVADCERMVWTGGKWMVGAGAEPVEPPSVWPDTDLAIKVGYKDLVK